jgi:hypothetical protein|uniref:DSBA-like thioredoxin domain-containing protein n=1 Tax=Phaeodactylum tricornutum TaxID=2850 RepID=A0A8J9S989_PHATR
MTKQSWKIFWDLQCPFAKKNWERFPEIKKRFADQFDFSVYLTSLAFHPQAFPGQCAAKLIENFKGTDARFKFIDACYANQERYTNKALGDARMSEIDSVFCDIAKEAGILDEKFNEDFFLANVHDWTEVVKPAYEEHKIAMGYGVFGTPKHVIEDELVLESESSWGPDEWANVVDRLKSQ